MKGIVFTEFIEMVEDRFGYEVADQIIAKAELKSGGVYTAIGTYDHGEMVALLVELNKMSGMPISDLLKVYGEHLFVRFGELYAQFFENVPDAFSFLESIDQYIHKEVLKLYPDAELPSFHTTRVGDNELHMLYHSERKMADFAYGLIKGCLAYFKEIASIDMAPVAGNDLEVLFKIKRQ